MTIGEIIEMFERLNKKENLKIPFQIHKEVRSVLKNSYLILYIEQLKKFKDAEKFEVNV